MVEYRGLASMSSRTVTQNEQIAWMLKGKMEFRLGSEPRVCGRGDVAVIPGGTEHEACSAKTPR
jgi:quercetin dioxygenase-like cupin family protein